MASSLFRAEYVEDAVSEYSWPGDFHKALAMGQLMEYREIASTLADGLANLADDA